MKKKIIHIHTDIKFVYNTKMFACDFFENKVIIIGNNKDFNSEEGFFYFKRTLKDFNRILELCLDADLIVLYSLDNFKMKIALSLNKRVKIAWRFFGSELYSKRPDLFKSELSRKFDKNSLRTILRSKASKIYNWLKNSNFFETNYYLAVKKIDYFFALSSEEHLSLKQHFPELPVFVKLPHFYLGSNKNDFDLKKKANLKPKIIIGNNRSSYNNHLDLIRIINKYQNECTCEFLLLFNYGRLSRYTSKVLGKIKTLSNFTIKQNYLKKEEFNGLYDESTALVINGYRQMAGANIRLALQSGVKVYLSEKNPEKKFLQNEGFIIFSIEDFKNDLKFNKLNFDEYSAIHNANNFKSFSKSYSQFEFQNEIYKLLN